ncbi:NAD-dependent epimerase/dehydratase family protein [Rhodopirellula sp. JC740]|uniref:NAD-dependent epimerase/dehydratase family protein n=1 Tax=Rhodopirellula halodulae TaxID=2894198 RepID=A0ABS8NK91_9BACT|nr:NAD-dependent epimerase/dehydratase family protein [Rhodopirellula sp. JC740]MCC9643973.1 NAD-dependent epimerase/dehydratase family protein [Rhodopirellula sp. JC740]
MRVFVTGGTGLLGNTILRQLSDAGHDLIALVRGEPDPQVFDGINTQFAHGNLLDQPTIEDAVAKSDAVIHSAGMIHLGWKCFDESIAVNRDGTQTIVDACLHHDCKLVHVGTVNTLAIADRDSVADETTPLDHAGGQVPCSYVLSKRAGNEVVKDGVKKGLRAAIVHPGFMLGPWDWKPSSGRMMLEVSKAWRPLTPSGGNSSCDSRDVAAAAIRAAEKLITNDIEPGRHYILAGHNMRYLELWKAMASAMGAKSPIMRAGPAQRWIAGVAGDVVGKLLPAEPDFNSAAVRMSSQYHYYDSSRAKKELDYRIRPFEETLQDAAQWLRDHHGKPSL